MKLEIYQVDAFTNRLFGGNPAAVVPLEKWIDDKLMQNLAMENNLAETPASGRFLDPTARTHSRIERPGANHQEQRREG